jgi:hypothetical protein
MDSSRVEQAAPPALFSRRVSFRWLARTALILNSRFTDVEDSKQLPLSPSASCRGIDDFSNSIHSSTAFAYYSFTQIFICDFARAHSIISMDVIGGCPAADSRYNTPSRLLLKTLSWSHSKTSGNGRGQHVNVK